MTAWAYAEPTSVLREAQSTLDSLSYPMASGSTFLRGAVLSITGGTLAAAATNAAASALAGVALKDAADVYYAGQGGAVTGPALFGGSTVGTALTPSEPLNMHIYPFAGGNEFEISLKDIWQPGTGTGPGTLCGLLLDATTGLYVLDSTQTNKPFAIRALRSLAVASFQSGDTGVRVVAWIPPATAAGV